MAFYELDEVFGYQDANRIKKLWASDTPPAAPGEEEVWLDTSGIIPQLKRLVGGVWKTIGDVSPDDILAKIKTVDGPSSGLDADLLDGQDGPFYLNAGNLNAGTVPLAQLPDTLTGKDADTVDGLHGASLLRSDADDTFSGTLTSSKTNGVALKFDEGDTMITVHDGHGNFNIKSGVDENHTIINCDGASHLEFAESGSITAAVSSKLTGETFTDDTYVKIDSVSTDVEATQFRVLQGGVEKLKVGTDGKIYEGAIKLEDKYIMKEDFIYTNYITSGFLPRYQDDPITLLNTTGRGSIQISFSGGTDGAADLIKTLRVYVDGVLACDCGLGMGSCLVFHFNTSIQVDAKASPLYVKCNLSYCAR